MGPVAVPVRWVPSLGSRVAHPQGSGAGRGTSKQEGLAGADKAPAWLEASSSPAVPAQGVGAPRGAIPAQKLGDGHPSWAWRGKQECGAALVMLPEHLACPMCQGASRAASRLISVILLTRELPKPRHFQDILVSVLKGE